MARSFTEWLQLFCMLLSSLHTSACPAPTSSDKCVTCSAFMQDPAYWEMAWAQYRQGKRGSHQETPPRGTSPCEALRLSSAVSCMLCGHARIRKASRIFPCILAPVSMRHCGLHAVRRAAPPRVICILHCPPATVPECCAAQIAWSSQKMMILPHTWLDARQAVPRL